MFIAEFIEVNWQAFSKLTYEKYSCFVRYSWLSSHAFRTFVWGGEIFHGSLSVYSGTPLNGHRQIKNPERISIDFNILKNP